ncbi:MAG TPA: SurA N-terminal domain-containing protein [Candidatus Paceibacterota bacterium]|nr:SurA N-terminal domain-containing protein [Candidatus Paceibacterota bacterium]
MNEEKNENQEGAVKKPETTSRKRPSSKKRNVVIAAVVAVILIVAALGVAGYKTDKLGPISSFFSGYKAVAYVNGTKITENELATRFAPLEKQIEMTNFGTSTNKADLINSTKHQVLDDLINEKLLLAEANKAGITVTDEQVQEQYDASVQQYQAQQGAIASSSPSSTVAATSSFEDQLKEAGYTPTTYKEELRKQILISMYLTKQLDLNNIPVTDQETKALYDQYSSMPGVDKSQIPAYDDVKSTLQAQIQQQKAQQKVQDYVNQVRSKAQVKVLI